MLSDTQRVVISMRQIGLQIFFDVMFDIKFLAKFNHPMGVIRPVGGFCHANVVNSAYFVEAHKIVRLSHDFKRCIDIKCWLKTDPCKNPVFVEFFERVNSVIRKRRASFSRLDMASTSSKTGLVRARIDSMRWRIAASR